MFQKEAIFWPLHFLPPHICMHFTIQDIHLSKVYFLIWGQGSKRTDGVYSHSKRKILPNLCLLWNLTTVEKYAKYKEKSLKISKRFLRDYSGVGFGSPPGPLLVPCQQYAGLSYTKEMFFSVEYKYQSNTCIYLFIYSFTYLVIYWDTHDHSHVAGLELTVNSPQTK